MHLNYDFNKIIMIFIYKEDDIIEKLNYLIPG